jgi:pimeloyl-ACP methyl ester carboxylesterase
MGTMQEGAPEFHDEVIRREVLAQNDNAPHLERHAASFDVVDQLDTIGQPTLVIYGTRDAPFAAAARLLISHLPVAKELRVEGSGHHPLVEAHGAVISAIREFLTTTEDGALS